MNISLHDDEDGPSRMESMGISSSAGASAANKSSFVEKVTCAGVCFTIVFLLALFAMAAATLGVVIKRFDDLDNKAGPTAVNTVYNSLGLPGYRGKSWNDVVDASYGESVNIWMYGPSAASTWVQDWLADKVRDEYSITINVTEISSTADAANVVMSECDSACTASTMTSGGSVDMIWINGDNFYNLKTGDYLYGPWAKRVPSASNFDWTADDIAYDFGEPTQGYEMPYNKAQLVLVYNSTLISYADLPQSMADLVAALDGSDNTHPLYGKFTYPKPPDFTGAAFLRMFLYAFGGGVGNYDGDFDANKFNTNVPAVLTKLLSMEPGIYQSSGSPYYCTNLADCNDLFVRGEIAMTMSYNPAVAGANIAAGTWSAQVSSYVPNSGSIANNNFWTIPKNAANKLAAIVVANYIASIGAQFNRRSDSNRWIQAYDPNCPAITDELAGGWASAFEYLEENVFYNTTPSKTYLSSPYSLNEVSSQYKTALNADWITCFTDRETGAPCDGTSV